MTTSDKDTKKKMDFILFLMIFFHLHSIFEVGIKDETDP